MLESPETIDRLQQSLILQDLGYNLIPLIPGGKAPATKGWQTVRSSPALVRQWIAEGCNIGIPTGLGNNVVAFDCDKSAAKSWVLKNLPETPMVAGTPRGANHFFFRRPAVERIGNRVDMLRDRSGLDIRADLAFVVAAGSIHTPLGKQWFWLRGPELAAELPTFDPNVIPQAPPTNPESFKEDDPLRRIQRATRYVMQIRAIAGEAGHNQTFRAVCKLRDFGLSEHEAMTILIAWNSVNADPPWSLRELTKKLRDAYSKGTTNDQSRRPA